MTMTESLADALRDLSPFKTTGQSTDTFDALTIRAERTMGGTQYVIEQEAHGMHNRIHLTDTENGWAFARYVQNQNQWQTRDVATRVNSFEYGVARNDPSSIPGVRTYSDAKMYAEVKRRVGAFELHARVEKDLSADLP